MSIISRMRRQDAVWWEMLDARDQFGQPTYALPIQIKCRWDDEDVEVIVANGDKKRSRATVYVDRLMKVGDRLAKTTLAALEDPTDSNDTNDTNDSSPENANEPGWEIITFSVNPNLRNTENVYTAYL